MHLPGEGHPGPWDRGRGKGTDRRGKGTGNLALHQTDSPENSPGPAWTLLLPSGLEVELGLGLELLALLVTAKAVL